MQKMLMVYVLDYNNLCRRKAPVSQLYLYKILRVEDGSLIKKIYKFLN